MGLESPVSWPDLTLARRALVEGDGSGVKVAIIDSGIDVTHPALAGLTLADEVTVSCDGVNLRIEEGAGGDVYGHGTAVAALLRDVAPGAQVGSFRALDSSNHARSFVIAECVNQAINRGYQVINCSFGCRGLPRYVMDYKEWVDRAYLEGVQIVAACSNLDPGIREWPAYFPSVISVRGIDCGVDELYHSPRRLVSFLARGERVEVPWLQGATKIETGSSYAAPLVSGRIARLLGRMPSLNPAAVKPLLAELATSYLGES
jgi:subtilisin family serine protease